MRTQGEHGCLHRKGRGLRRSQAAHTVSRDSRPAGSERVHSCCPGPAPPPPAPVALGSYHTCPQGLDNGQVPGPVHTCRSFTLLAPRAPRTQDRQRWPAAGKHSPHMEHGFHSQASGGQAVPASELVPVPVDCTGASRRAHTRSQPPRPVRNPQAHDGFPQRLQNSVFKGRSLSSKRISFFFFSFETRLTR